MANIKMILGWLLLITVASVEGYVPQAHAMPPASPALAALLLARTCVREAGMEITDDCAAIHVVAQKRANLGRTHYESMIQLYSKPNAKGRAWIEQLSTTGEKPEGWPMSDSQWKHIYKAKWGALLKHARAIIRGEVEPACDPDHWGDALQDRQRALRYGWQQVSCGSARNEFWVVAPHPAKDEIAEN